MAEQNWYGWLYYSQLRFSYKTLKERGLPGIIFQQNFIYLIVPFFGPVISVTIWELKSFAALSDTPFSAYAVLQVKHLTT